MDSPGLSVVPRRQYDDHGQPKYLSFTFHSAQLRKVRTGYDWKITRFGTVSKGSIPRHRNLSFVRLRPSVPRGGRRSPHRRILGSVPRAPLLQEGPGLDLLVSDPTAQCRYSPQILCQGLQSPSNSAMKRDARILLTGSYFS